MQIRISKTLQKHLDAARYEAQHSGSYAIIPDIAFLSLLKEGMSHSGQVLRKILKDWEIYQLKVRIEREAAKIAAKGGGAADPDRVMTSLIEGVAENCALVSTDRIPVGNSGHFMLWILSHKELISARVLELYGVTADKVTELLTQMPDDEDYLRDMQLLDKLSQLARSTVPKYQTKKDPEPEEDDEEEEDEDYGGQTQVKRKTSRAKSVLDQFGVNLSVSASEGKLDPVVGRDREIQRLIQILGRRKKNNPVLIGEAGVGKSAIVEGLALRILSGEVPRTLAGKEIFSLDVASLVAGTKYRGQFEERIKALLKELSGNKNIILFIDEIHTIAGAGSTQGSLDTANILKPALARGELQCIGATTLDEYREYIEADAALERRFQKIIVEPTSKEETLSILHNIKSHYEQHHGVRYTDESLEACVELTGRYVSDRNFPDKAIDALDEAGSKARQFGSPEPSVIRELEAALALAEKARKQAVASLQYEKAADAKIKALGLRNRLKESRKEWEEQIALNPVVIGVEHIEEVITSMTGIPVEKVSQGEKGRLANMENHLSGKVIGQDEAVGKVVRSIQRSRTGLKDPNKPIGVFMFVGPTGVGKTHLAKELSRWMFDRPDSLIRIDMSEYSEKHNVSRMIGSPPGYVGYNEGGQLTEAVRRQPYSVVLFDEIEKAHPDVFNVMLQIFDEGQLTDGLGRKIDFRNTIIIMTSNVGSRKVVERGPSVGYLTSNSGNIEEVNRDSDYRGSLERTFAPEFINRIDDIVVFNRLMEEDVQSIVGLELDSLSARLSGLGYKLNVTPKARRELAAIGYDSRYGVRSLKRTILDHVEEPLAELIVLGEICPGDTVRVEYRAAGITVLRQAEPIRKAV